MKNPFVFGQTVAGESFTNRQDEKKRLSANFNNGIHTILIAPRRWGKASLVEEVSGRLVKSKAIRVVKLDLYDA